MVRIMIEMPCTETSRTADNAVSCKEFAIIELQGDLETRHPVPLSGKFIGDLHFTDKDVPVLIIGHHILQGKTVNLEKPLAVMTKSSSSTTSTTTATTIISHDAMDTNQDGLHSRSNEEDRASSPSSSSSSPAQYSIQAVIRKKLIFKTRPKPIIAHVPKKI